MKILISGGSGLVGEAISDELKKGNHQIGYLSRKAEERTDGIREYYWDPDKGEIDTAALQGVEAIINLAGAPLNHRWTPEYKSEILRSRVDATRLLYKEVQKQKPPLKVFLSASASGYYPSHFHKEFTEEDAPGSNFLSLVCQKWEQEAQNFELLGIRTVRLRIGIVLSDQGGALKEFVKPIKFGLGAPLGSGRQWMPWIHIEDLALMFVYCLEHEQINGVYNASGPYNVSNKELNRAIAKSLKRPFFLPNVPAIALKIALGEMANMVLSSNRISSSKIQSAGFHYKHNHHQNALDDLLK